MRTGEKLLSMAAAAALLATACAADDPDVADRRSGDRTVDLGDIRGIAQLTTLADCDGLLDHLRSEALERVGPYGLEGGPYGFAATGAASGGELVADDAAAAPRAATQEGAGDASGAGGFSTTNVQEAGVDEPDTVKTDGEYVYSTLDGTLTIVDVAARTVVGRLDLPDDVAAGTFFIDGDRALLLSGGSGFGGRGPRPLPVDVLLEGDVARPGGFASGTKLITVDISDRSAPTVVEETTIEGDLVTARLFDGTARVVLRTHPTAVGFVYPSASTPAAETTAEQANRAVIEQTTLDDWLPSFETGDGTEAAVPCEQVHVPGEFGGFGMTTVATVDLHDSFDPARSTTVVADSDTAYATSSSLYVTANRWVPVADQQDRVVDEDWTTAIHQFGLDVTGPADYLASGTVRGHLLNQFSLSEHERHLRVATTDGAPWSASEDSESFMTVLRPDGDRLTEVAQVAGLGRGEQIFSVRYVGDTAYVVTFRQTDPLYVLDLADPAAPEVLGELKINGFSSYLHPIDDGRIVGVGQDATDEGRTTGLHVQVFDVSDRRNPTRTAQHAYPGGYSAAEGDHHAFLHWAARDLIVLPVEICCGDPRPVPVEGDDAIAPETFSEPGIAMRVLRLDGGSLVDVARVAQSDDGSYEYAQRSAVIGETLWTFSDQSMVISDLDSFERLARITT